MTKTGRSELPRPNRHIDGQELEALASWDPDPLQHESAFAQEIRDAQGHLLGCKECAQKVVLYRALLSGRTRREQPFASILALPCRKGESVDWNEVVAGQWPEFKVRQLMTHAALCDQCGPSLRTAVRLRDSASRIPTPAPESPNPPPTSHGRAQAAGFSLKQLLPALVMLLILSGISFLRVAGAPLSGESFAAFAAETYRQHEDGNLDLEIRSESAATLNAWFKQNLRFPLTLPVAQGQGPSAPEPTFLGARRLEIKGGPAAYIAYRTSTGPASLVITTDAVAVASGGSVADYQKVSFHYSVVHGYKVVTWSQHGLTYALVSQEGTGSQQSCMVCHSAMRDLNLTHKPTPSLRDQGPMESILRRLE